MRFLLFLSVLSLLGAATLSTQTTSTPSPTAADKVNSTMTPTSSPTSSSISGATTSSPSTKTPTSTPTSSSTTFTPTHSPTSSSNVTPTHSPTSSSETLSPTSSKTSNSSTYTTSSPTARAPTSSNSASGTKSPTTNPSSSTESSTTKSPTRGPTSSSSNSGSSTYRPTETIHPSKVPFTNSPGFAAAETSAPGTTAPVNWFDKYFSIAPSRSASSSILSTTSSTALAQLERELYTEYSKNQERDTQVSMDNKTVAISGTGQILNDNIAYEVKAETSSDDSLWFRVGFSYRPDSSQTTVETQYYLDFYAIYEYVEVNGVAGYQEGEDTLSQNYRQKTWNSFQSISSSSNYNQFSITTMDEVTSFRFGYSGKPNCTISGVLMNQNQAKLDMTLNNFPFVNDSGISQLCVAARITVPSANQFTSATHSNVSLWSDSSDTLGGFSLSSTASNSTSGGLLTWVQNVTFDGVTVDVFTTGFTLSTDRKSWTTQFCFDSTNHPEVIEWDPTVGSQGTGNTYGTSYMSYNTASSSATTTKASLMACVLILAGLVMLLV